MAKKQHGLDLFEVLSRHQSVHLSDSANKAGEDRQQIVANAAKVHAQPLSGRELVFSIETAFVIFMSTLILVASGYYLGYQRGADEARNEKTGKPATEIADSESSRVTTLRNAGETVKNTIHIDGKLFTLQVLQISNPSDAEKERLKLDQEYLRGLPVVMESGLKDIYVFENGSTHLFILGVGLFKDNRDQTLARLRQALQQDPGPSHRSGKPYGACSPVQVEKLGTPVF